MSLKSFYLTPQQTRTIFVDESFSQIKKSSLEAGLAQLNEELHAQCKEASTIITLVEVSGKENEFFIIASQNNQKAYVYSFSSQTGLQESKSYAALIASCEEEDINQIIDTHSVIAHQADTTTWQDKFLIHEAIEQKKTSIVEKLVKDSRQCNLMDKEEETCLYKAVKSKQPEIIRIVRQTGAKVNLPCHDLTPIALFMKSFNPSLVEHWKTLKILLGSKTIDESLILTDEEQVLLALHFYQHQTAQLKDLHNFFPAKKLLLLAVNYCSQLKSSEFSPMDKESASGPELLLIMLRYCKTEIWPENLFAPLIALGGEYPDRLKFILANLPIINNLAANELVELFQYICSQSKFVSDDASAITILVVLRHYLDFYYVSLSRSLDLELVIDQMPMKHRCAQELVRAVKDWLEKSPYMGLSNRIKKLKDSEEKEKLTEFLKKIAEIETKIVKSEIIKTAEKLEIIEEHLKFFKDKEPKKRSIFSASENPAIADLTALKEKYISLRSTLNKPLSVLLKKLPVEFPKLPQLASHQFICKLKEKEDQNIPNNGTLTYLMQLGLSFDIPADNANKAAPKQIETLEERLNADMRGMFLDITNTIAIQPDSVNEQRLLIKIGITDKEKWKIVLQRLATFNLINAQQKSEITKAIDEKLASMGVEIEIRFYVQNERWQGITEKLRNYPDVGIANILVNNRAETLFLTAISANQADLIKPLLANGATITARNHSKNGWLHLAIRHKSYKAMDQMLQAGHGRDAKDWDVKNLSGISPLEYATQAFKQGDSQALEHYFEYTGKLPITFLDIVQQMSGIAERLVARTLGTDDMLEILRVFKDQLSDRFQNETSPIIYKYAERLARGFPTAYEKFYGREKTDKDIISTLPDALDFLHFLHYENGVALAELEKISDALYKEEEIKKWLPNCKNYVKVTIDLFKKALNDENPNLSHPNFNVHLGIILRTLCDFKCKEPEAAKTQVELIELFIKCGAYIPNFNTDILPARLAKLFINPHYKLSGIYGVGLIVGHDGHALDKVMINSLLKELRTVYLSEAAESANRSALAKINEYLDKHSFQKDNLDILLELKANLGISYTLKPVRDFKWDISSQLSFTVEAGSQLEEEKVENLMAIAINNKDTGISVLPITFEDTNGVVHYHYQIKLRLPLEDLTVCKVALDNLVSHAFFDKTLAEGLFDDLKERLATSNHNIPGLSFNANNQQ